MVLIGQANHSRGCVWNNTGDGNQVPARAYASAPTPMTALLLEGKTNLTVRAPGNATILAHRFLLRRNDAKRFQRTALRCARAAVDAATLALGN